MKEITVIHGFGVKHYESGVYIDGKLFTTNAEFDNAENLVKLVKKMAKTFSVKWTEFTAPEVFRLNSYYAIPKTLAMYEKEAVALFKSLPTFDSIDDVIYYEFPMEEYQIRRVVDTTYMLSGGLDKNFKEFYQNIYKPQFPSANKELEKEYAYLSSKHAQSRYENREKQEAIYAQLREIQLKLDDEFKQTLQFVWDYSKPLNPFKQLALKPKGIKLK